MHCPTCREENAPTTRFCTSCGAVLVEEAPGGGRRRVLRPWGLRRSAPPTVSPDFPDVTGGGVARPATGPARAAGPALRVDLWLSGAVVAVLSAVAVLHPGLQASESRPAPLNAETLVAAPAVVTIPLAPVVAEARLASPALVEATRPKESEPKREPAAPVRRSREPVVAVAIYAPAAVPVPEPVAVAAAAPVAPMPARPPADRWQGL
ncbi:MAG TPA: zinc ribbon domain-containing protein, partial [Casimicrobiaceae bacterium]|nr:zinc ribbon domain-containing protein [Casimicrobiaceae bacterium]